MGGLVGLLYLIGMIVKKGSKWCVVSKKTRRSFGCYRTKHEAVHRLQQVEFFKHKFVHHVAVVFGLMVFGVMAMFALSVLAIEHRPKTVEVLREVPKTRKVRVLIVPGHEPGFGGTSVGKIVERDLNVELGKKLQGFLDGDGGYETMLARDMRSWHPLLARYFDANWKEIDDWRKEARDEMEARIGSGEVARPVVHIGHNAAPNDVAVRLYGVTKWANENDFDVMVHVHFDDDRSSTRAAGFRNGLVIYVPSPEYYNGAPTRVVAEKVLGQLVKFDSVSNLKAAVSGIVDDPELIAVGRQNTSDAVSMLVEYGFIYEKQLQVPEVRAMALEDMAYRTYVGLEDFFDTPGGGSSGLRRQFGTTVLPYRWHVPIRVGAAGVASKDVFALQTALIAAGVFPPAGKSKNACPRNGVFDGCVREAVKAFQKKYGIVEDGVGVKTVGKLNEKFGG